jgi:hypothetical protein
MEVQTASHKRAENLLYDPNSNGRIPFSAISGLRLLDQDLSALSSIVEFNANIFSRTGLLNSSDCDIIKRYNLVHDVNQSPMISSHLRSVAGGKIHF